MPPRQGVQVLSASMLVIAASSPLRVAQARYSATRPDGPGDSAVHRPKYLIKSDKFFSFFLLNHRRPRLNLTIIGTPFRRVPSSFGPIAVTSWRNEDEVQAAT